MGIVRLRPLGTFSCDTAQLHPYIFPSFPSFLPSFLPSFRMLPALLPQPMDLGAWFSVYRCSSSCILHKFRSVNPPHWQYPAPMGSWQVPHYYNQTQVLLSKATEARGKHLYHNLNGFQILLNWHQSLRKKKLIYSLRPVKTDFMFDISSRIRFSPFAGENCTKFSFSNFS